MSIRLLDHAACVKPLELRDAIPGARLAWVDEAAHWVVEEKPMEVAAALKAFLAGEGE